MNEEQQNRLAKAIQTSVPIEARPFQVLGSALGLSEQEVIAQVKVWKESGELREISAVMEGAVLGYDSALVCGKIPRERLAEVAEIVSQHPTVTHNYERVHDYNLWFTIAVPREWGLENHLRALEVLTGVEHFYPLRRTMTFKIGVVFDLQTKSNDTKAVEISEQFTPVVLNAREKQIVLALQRDLPIGENPFRMLAEAEGFHEEEILGFLKSRMGEAVRRFIGTFRHRKLGVNFNGMTVWNVPEAEVREKGLLLASFPEVSHCYARGTAPGFPYGLYSMLHGPQRKAVVEVAEEIAQRLECPDFLILHSPTEFKKCRLRYFLPELEQWWEEHRMKAQH